MKSVRLKAFLIFNVALYATVLILYNMSVFLAFWWTIQNLEPPETWLVTCLLGASYGGLIDLLYGELKRKTKHFVIWWKIGNNESR